MSNARIWVAAGFLIVASLAVRGWHVDGPGIASDRQYRSYLIARAHYLEASESAPDWRRRVAAASSQRQEPLEPTVTERVVAGLYGLFGGEDPRLARATSSLFWLLGAIPLFLLALRVGAPFGAFAAVAYYLLLPAAVLTSLSFLPEPLMILGLLCSVLTIVRYWESPSTSRLAVAAVVSSLAVLVKPLVVFCILGAYVALGIHARGGKRILDRRTLLFALVSLVPGLLFYGRGIFLDDYLRWKVDVSFVPGLFLSTEFWRGWLRVASDWVGRGSLVVALLGFPLLAGGFARHLLLGLWAGYVLFCLAFNYFTHFVGYYHTQLIVIVALSLVPAIDLLTDRLRQLRGRWYGWSPVIAALGLLLLFQWRAVGRGHDPIRHEGREVASEIGRIVEHSTRVAYLAPEYGLPLEYHGELAGEYWPRPTRGWPLVRAGERPLGIEERLETLGFRPEYFVITDMGEYRRHHEDLKAFLEARSTLRAADERYLVYELPRTMENP